MENLSYLGTVLSLVSVLGFYFAYRYGHKTKRFRLREYLAMIFVPLLSVLLLAYFLTAQILLLFLVSAVVGFLFEYGFGFAYHKTLNQRLWVYQRMSIDGYTSVLSLPVWGIAGVVFWSLGQLLGV